MKSAVAFTGLEAQSRALRPIIDKNIADVLDHGQFIMGPEIGRLERELAEFCGARHAIAVANGTDALQIALMAQGVGPGDAVLVPSFTYTATAEVILVLGAQPVFVDVDASSFNIDSKKIAAGLAEARERGLTPRAIIAVDLFGLPADWEELNRIAAAEKLVLIADAAQSFGAKTAAGDFVGTLAPITTASFFPAKPLGCYGDGGAIFTDDDALAAIIRSIRVHGQGAAKYETVRVGMNSRLDTLQAAILLAKLEVFASEITARNVLAERYTSELSDIYQIPVKPSGVTSAWAQYTLRLAQRDQLQQHLKELQIPTAIYYPCPMHLQPAYASFGRGPGSLPVSEELSGSVLSIPMNPYCGEEEFQTIITGLKSFGSASTLNSMKKSA